MHPREIPAPLAFCKRDHALGREEEQRRERQICQRHLRGDPQRGREHDAQRQRLPESVAVSRCQPHGDSPEAPGERQRHRALEKRQQRGRTAHQPDRRERGAVAGQPAARQARVGARGLWRVGGPAAAREEVVSLGDVVLRVAPASWLGGGGPHPRREVDRSDEEEVDRGRAGRRSHRVSGRGEKLARVSRARPLAPEASGRAAVGREPPWRCSGRCADSPLA